MPRSRPDSSHSERSTLRGISDSLPMVDSEQRLSIARRRFGMRNRLELSKKKLSIGHRKAKQEPIRPRVATKDLKAMGIAAGGKLGMSPLLFLDTPFFNDFG